VKYIIYSHTTNEDIADPSAFPYPRQQNSKYKCKELTSLKLIVRMM